MRSTDEQKQTPKVLIVDDEETIVELLIKIINRAGYGDVLTAYDGDSALELYRSEKPDIVFTDYLMDGMDGISLIEEIWAEDPNVPIAIFSGFCVDAVAEASFKSLKQELKKRKVKPNHVFRKPFEAKDIIDVIKRYFP